MADGGIFRGARQEGAEYFDDIMGDNSTPEIFRTDQGGIGAYDSVQAQAGPTGMTIVMHCRPPGCGHRRNVILSWPELFVVAYAPQTDFLPPDWDFSAANQSPYPKVTCPCGEPVAPMIPCDWAMRQVSQAIQNQVVTQQQLMGDPSVRQAVAILQRGQQQAPQAQQLPQQMPPGGWYPR